MTHSFAIGDSLFGIRTNSEACADWLAETLAAYEYTDENADAYYSIHVAEESVRGVGKPFHILYRESATVVKTFDLTELGRALIAELETLTLSRRDDAIYLTCSPVSKNGTTALVPSELLSFVTSAGTGLVARHGLRLADSFALAVEPGGRLTTVNATLDVPNGAAERLAEIAPARASRRAAAAIPAVPDLILIGNPWQNESEPLRPVSRGFALYHLASLTKNLRVLQGTALGGLASLLDGVPCYEIRGGRAVDLLETLSDVLGAQRAA